MMKAFLRLAPLSALLIVLSVTVSALAQTATEETTSQTGQQSLDSTAEEWKKRREAKAQNAKVKPPSTIEKAFLYMESGRYRSNLSLSWKNLYPKLGSLTAGSGFSPGIRYFKPKLLKTPLTFETSAAFSFSGYKMVSASIGKFNKIAPYTLLGPGDFEAPFEFFRERPDKSQTFLYGDFRWEYFPRESFYGLGPDSSVDDRTNFLIEQGVYELVAGYQSDNRLGVAARLGFRQVNGGRGTDKRFPSIGDVFDPDSVPGLDRQPDFLRLSTAVYFDYRDVPGNPHKGGVVSFAFTRFDEYRGSQYQFNQYSVDLRQFIPLGSRQRVLALRAFTTADKADSGSEIPFYFQQTLGGGRTLRGFRHSRFRDSNLVYASAEYRWEPAPAVEFAFFYDAGKVFPVDQGWNLRNLESSYGGGIRFKTSRQVVVRLDIGLSKEGTQVSFSFTPVF
jgi:hypothetical protein